MSSPVDLIIALWTMAKSLKVPQKVVDGARTAIQQIVSEDSGMLDEVGSPR